MKKFFSLISVIIIIIFITSGCVSEGSVTVKDVDQKIRTIVTASRLKKENAEGLEKLYGINETELEDFVLYTSKSKDSAEEILVLKVKYLSSTDIFMDKIQKRLNMQAKKFKKTSPEEYKEIKNSLLESRQTFIIFVISKDKPKIEEQFHKMVQN